MSALPAELRPSWRAVPRLIWVAARAERPTPGALGRARGIAAAVFLAAPAVLGAQLCGQLVSLDRHALLVIRWQESPLARAVRQALIGLALALPWLLVLLALWTVGHWTAAWILPVGRPASLFSPQALPYLVQLVSRSILMLALDLGYLAALGALLLPRPAVLRERRVARRQERAARARFRIRRRRSIYLAAFAAWPQHRGHGLRLAERVQPTLAAAAASGDLVLTVARNAALAGLGEKLGLQPVEPDSLVLISPAPLPAARNGSIDVAASPPAERRPEPAAQPDDDADATAWLVWRQDEYGTCHPVARFTSRQRAEEAADALEWAGYQQTYCVTPQR